MSAASDRIRKLFEEAKTDNYYKHAWYSHLDLHDVESVLADLERWEMEGGTAERSDGSNRGTSVPAADRLEKEVVVDARVPSGQPLMLPKLFTFTNWADYWKEKNARG